MHFHFFSGKPVQFNSREGNLPAFSLSLSLSSLCQRNHDLNTRFLKRAKGAGLKLPSYVKLETSGPAIGLDDRDVREKQLGPHEAVTIMIHFESAHRLTQNPVKGGNPKWVTY